MIIFLMAVGNLLLALCPERLEWVHTTKSEAVKKAKKDGTDQLTPKEKKEWNEAENLAGVPKHGNRLTQQ